MEGNTINNESYSRVAEHKSLKQLLPTLDSSHPTFKAPNYRQVIYPNTASKQRTNLKQVANTENSHLAAISLWKTILLLMHCKPK